MCLQLKLLNTQSVRCSATTVKKTSMYYTLGTRYIKYCTYAAHPVKGYRSYHTQSIIKMILRRQKIVFYTRVKTVEARVAHRRMHTVFQHYYYYIFFLITFYLRRDRQILFDVKPFDEKKNILLQLTTIARGTVQ